MARKRPAQPKRSSKKDILRTADFLIAMSRIPELRDAWRRDPERTMSRWGLSEEGKAALRSGDPDAVRMHLGDDSPAGCFFIDRSGAI